MTHDRLWRTLWRDSRIRAIFGLAIIIHLIFLGYLVRYPGGILSGSDSLEYNELAQNLLHYRVFARGVMPADGSGPTALSPEVQVRGAETTLIYDPYRTPGYPAFLALIYGIGGGPFLAVIAQIVLSLLFIWLTVLLAARLFEPGVGWRVALLAALEPLTLIYSHRIMSDFVCALLTLGAVYCFLPMLTDQEQDKPLTYACLGGGLLGLAMLTRPPALYFPGLLLILSMVKVLARKRQTVAETSGSPKQPHITSGAGLKYLAVFMVVALFTALPWVVRNYVIFHRAFFSTSSEANFFIQGASQVEAAIRDPEGRISTWQIREELERELITRMGREGLNTASEPERMAYLGKWSWKIFMAHPSLFIHYYLKGVASQFFSDVPGFYVLLDLRKGQNSWANLSRQGILAALANYFGKYWPLWVAAALPIVLYDLGLYILACCGIIALWRTRNYFLLFMLIAIIGYWVALSSLGGNPRYRLPIMPYLIALAAWGWFNITKSESLILGPVRKTIIN